MRLDTVNSFVVQLGKYPFSNVFLVLLMRTTSPTRNRGFLEDNFEDPLGPYKVFHTLEHCSKHWKSSLPLELFGYSDDKNDYNYI